MGHTLCFTVILVIMINNLQSTEHVNQTENFLISIQLWKNYLKIFQKTNSLQHQNVPHVVFILPQKAN